MKNNAQPSQGRTRTAIFSILFIFFVFLSLGFQGKTTRMIAVYLQTPTATRNTAPFRLVRREPNGGDNTNNDIVDNFALAREQSFGFFTDISNEEWKRIQTYAHKIQPNICDSSVKCRFIHKKEGWFQNNYEPEISCQHEQRLGQLGDGGKWVCDPYRIAAKPTCLVYSVGSKNDFSFEESVFADIGTHCEIHTFDPADYSARALQIRNNGIRSLAGANKNSTTTTTNNKSGILNLNYHQWGIDAENRIDTNGKQFLTMNETVHRLGHVGRTIDIFKIDCEGCEIKSFRTWVGLQDIVRIQQVLVEVHSHSHEFFQGMQQEGYTIFHKEPNLIALGHLVEYAFLKLMPHFYNKTSS
ncbi:hypothetical protein ACA910_013365 [Epithemia clementina (nom. ined.)]